MPTKLIKTEVIKQMEFDGDIVITDPCYINDETNDSDRNFLSVKVKNIQNDTLYGDWSCTVWKANNDDECIDDNKIGTFCADSGMVIVADWEQVKKYNSEAEQWVEAHDWCATVIKGFKGIVKMIRFDYEITYNEDWYPESSYGHKKGDTYIDRSLRLYGTGNINWIGAQTGF